MDDYEDTVLGSLNATPALAREYLADMKKWEPERKAKARRLRAIIRDGAVDELRSTMREYGQQGFRGSKIRRTELFNAVEIISEHKYPKAASWVYTYEAMKLLRR